jgi:hypothetical protein
MIKGASDYNNYMSEHTDISSRSLNIKPYGIRFAADVLPVYRLQRQ